MKNQPILIQNITFSYSLKEDRIFFIVNQNDFNNRIDFAVTRRKIISLLSGFDELLIKYCDSGKLLKEILNQESKKINQTNQQKKQIAINKWEKPVNDSDLKLTQKQIIPYLLEDISFNIDKNIFIFKFISNKKVLAYAKMDCNLFQQTLSSLLKIIPFIEWGISKSIITC